MLFWWSFAFHSSISSLHLWAWLSFSCIYVCQREFWWRSCFAWLAVKNVLVSVCLQTVQHSWQIRWLTACWRTRTQGLHRHTRGHSGMCAHSGEIFVFQIQRGQHLSFKDAMTRRWPSNFQKSNIFLLATTNLCYTEITFIITVISPSVFLTSIPTFNPHLLSHTHTP